MNSNEIKQKIRDFLINLKQLENNEIQFDTFLLTAGIIDSFDMLNLLDYIEKEFQIEVDGDDVLPENFDTIDRICDYVIKRS